MKSFTLPPYKIDPNIENGIIDENVHIVCTAVKKNGFCTKYLSKRGMSSYDIAGLCDIVNREDKREVGTLFPKFTFTLIPLQEKGDDIKKKFQTYLKDVIIAHLKYYQECKTILFIFDHSAGYPADEIKSLLEETLNTLITSNLKEINSFTKMSVNQIQNLLDKTELFYTVYSS